MTSQLYLGNAPTSWGIEKASDPTYPTWSRVLDEVAQAGFAGTELGPYGYLPTDPKVLTRELGSRGLTLTAGTLMEPFHEISEKPRILQSAESICRLLASQRARYLVIIGAIVPEREKTAGRTFDAPRLKANDLDAAVETIDSVGEIATRRGIQPVLHTHAGTYFEFADELDALVSSVSEQVQFCVDTGHAIYAGIDPVNLIRDVGSRLAYVHLKDINPTVLEAARVERLSFWQAYARGIFCLLGDGLADFKGIVHALKENGYEGWLTVEQDASPVANNSPLETAKANREFILRLLKGVAPHAD